MTFPSLSIVWCDTEKSMSKGQLLLNLRDILSASMVTKLDLSKNIRKKLASKALSPVNSEKYASGLHIFYSKLIISEDRYTFVT